MFCVCHTSMNQDAWKRLNRYEKPLFQKLITSQQFPCTEHLFRKIFLNALIESQQKALKKKKKIL